MSNPLRIVSGKVNANGWVLAVVQEGFQQALVLTSPTQGTWRKIDQSNNGAIGLLSADSLDFFGNIVWEARASLSSSRRSYVRTTIAKVQARQSGDPFSLSGFSFKTAGLGEIVGQLGYISALRTPASVASQGLSVFSQAGNYTVPNSSSYFSESGFAVALPSSTSIMSVAGYSAIYRPAGGGVSSTINLRAMERVSCVSEDGAVGVSGSQPAVFRRSNGVMTRTNLTMAATEVAIPVSINSAGWVVCLKEDGGYSLKKDAVLVDLAKVTQGLPQGLSTNTARPKLMSDGSILHGLKLLVPQPDADNDGIADGFEADSDLLANNDNDQDGLPNWKEFVHATNPLLADSDGDTSP